MVMQNNMEQLLEGCSSQVKSIVEKLRATVFRGMPIAQERVDVEGHSIIYGLDSLGPNLCALAIGGDSVEVRFSAGGRLSDPGKLLVGLEGDLRTITVGPESDVSLEAIERLVAQAFVMNAG